MVSIGNEVDIDVQRVFRNIGYRTDYRPSARVESLISEYVENVCHLIEPAYSYVIRDVEMVQGPRVVIEGSITFKSQVIARLLEQCQKVAVFLVTIGNHLEEMVCRLAEDKLVLQAAVLDAIGSDIAETVADFVQGKVGEVAGAQGLCISRRFSPGYCDWDVRQQRNVFRAMNGDCAGIRLTEGCLMLPRKSVSGVIGIGPSWANLEQYNPCETCDKLDCAWRR